MKDSTILSIDLNEALDNATALEQTGGNYPEGTETEEVVLEGIVYYVYDATIGERFGPYATHARAAIVAEERKKNFPGNTIIIESLGRQAEVEPSGALELRFWVLHFEKDRRYGPFFSFNTAIKVRNRKQEEFPKDTFDIEEEEFFPDAEGLSAEGVEENEVSAEELQLQQVLAVRMYFEVQGFGSFKANHFNTAIGHTSGWFKPGTGVQLIATAGPGHKFSHWTMNGNFGGNNPRHRTGTIRGLKIRAVFVDS